MRRKCASAHSANCPRSSASRPIGFRVPRFRTKKDLARGIAEETGLTQIQVLEVVQKVFDGITAVLVAEGRIELRNFGVFEVRRRKPRKARNPRTSDQVKVPAKLVVTFKAGLEMGEQVARLKDLPNGRNDLGATAPGGTN